MKFPSAKSQPLTLYGSACANPHEADRLRLWAAKAMGPEEGRRIITVTHHKHLYVCGHTSSAKSLTLPGQEWWLYIIAAAVSAGSQTMIWGVPAILLWQALEDAGIVLGDVHRLGRLVRPGGSALYWLDGRTPSGLHSALAERRALERLDLAPSLEQRLTSAAAAHSLVVSS